MSSSPHKLQSLHLRILDEKLIETMRYFFLVDVFVRWRLECKTLHSGERITKPIHLVNSVNTPRLKKPGISFVEALFFYHRDHSAFALDFCSKELQKTFSRGHVSIWIRLSVGQCLMLGRWRCLVLSCYLASATRTHPNPQQRGLGKDRTKNDKDHWLQEAQLDLGNHGKIGARFFL